MPTIGGIKGLSWKMLSSLSPVTRLAPLVYTRPSAIPLTAMAHGTAAAGFIHTSYPGFAVGHFPAGNKLTGQIGGQSFDFQTDMQTYWNDGSVRTARVSAVMPVTLPADTLTGLTVAPSIATPVTTPWITPAAMAAAHDFQLQSYGLDCGATTFTTSFRDIVTNAPRDTWGLNPLAGWDVPIAGPVEVMVRAWSYRKAAGAYHRWLRDVMYVSARVDGSYEVACGSEMPNFDRPHPGGTLGAATVASRMACYVELYDGASRLAAWGGPNDPRTAAVATTEFRADNTLGSGINPAITRPGVGLTLSGPGLPSGLTAGTLYYCNNVNWLPVITTARGASYNVFTAVPFGTAGTGTVTITPFVLVGYGSRPLFVGSDSFPVRVGGPARVPVTWAWDEAYMSRGAKLFPCYSQDPAVLARYTSAQAGAVSADAYYPTQVFNDTTWLNQTGDNNGDDRVGYINHSNIQSLLQPHDVIYRTGALRAGALWSDQPIWWRDVSSGRVLVVDNGPNDAGSVYPQMGPCRPNLSMISGVNAGLGTWLSNDGGTGGTAWGGYLSGYSNCPLDGSHRPSPWVVPCFLTGHPMYADQGIFDAVEGSFGEDAGSRSPTIAGTTYYSVAGYAEQPRGGGWLIRTNAYAECFTPASSPEGAYIKHRMDTLGAWAAAVVTSNPPGMSIGLVAPWGSGGGNNFQVYMNSFKLASVAMEAWRGQRPGMARLSSALANSIAGLFNDTRQGNGWVVDVYATPTIDLTTVTTIPQLLLASYGAAGATPGPATGFQDAQTCNTLPPSCGHGPTLTSVMCALSLAYSADITSLNGDNCGAVWQSLLTRITAGGLTGLTFYQTAGVGNHDYTHNYTFPVFAIVPG